MREDKELEEQRRGIRRRLLLAFQRRQLEEKLTQADLGRRTGAASPTVNEWFNKENVVPDGVMLARIAKALKINAHWLLTNEGPMETREGQPEGTGEAFRAGAQAVLTRLDQILLEIRSGIPADEEVTRRASARLEQARRASEAARSTPGRRGHARRNAS